jgi:release factor glutamine methyltransferase
MPESDGTIVWAELLEEAQTRLAASGIENSAREARWIVEEASGNEGEEFVVGLADAATVRGVAAFDRLLSRRCAGEPLQYVLGHWPFRTLDLAVDARALVPRPETEQLVDWALAELDLILAAHGAATVVDLGTGTGAIALSIAVERPRTIVWASDASAAAVQLARENLAGIGRCGSRVRVVHGDWYAALPADLAGAVDLIVSNPPYVADGEKLDEVVSKWEPHSALFAGEDGLNDLRTIIAESPRWLSPHGALVVEAGSTQLDQVAALMAKAGLQAQVLEDWAGRPRFGVGRR